MLNWDNPLARETGKNLGVPLPGAGVRMRDGAPINANAQPAPLHYTASIPHSMADHATGLEQVEFGAARITVDDKQMINCRADLNQLVPFKYKWAWQKYLDA